VNIYVIEQNDVPCYFSWTEQPKQYSFPVLHPSRKQKIMLRMHDRAFIIDSLAFDRGKKTILSFDMNQLPQGVEVVWLRQRKGKYDEYKFTSEEKKRYERYLCRLPVMDGAVNAKIPVALFSLEMSNVQLVNRMIVNVCEIPGEKIKSGQLAPYEWGQLDYKIKELYDAPMYVDDTPSLSVFELRTKARRLVREHGVKIIIIDYLQLMNASGMSFGSRQEEVSTISRSLKGLAKELNIPIIALSQLNRGVESR
jgi:hypothetical protein